MCRWLRVRGYSQRKECYASVSTCTRVYSEEGVLCVGGYVYEGIVRNLWKLLILVFKPLCSTSLKLTKVFLKVICNLFFLANVQKSTLTTP